jgi:hypothetical protein
MCKLNARREVLTVMVVKTPVMANVAVFSGKTFVRVRIVAASTHTLEAAYPGALK